MLAFVVAHSRRCLLAFQVDRARILIYIAHSPSHGQRSVTIPTRNAKFHQIEGILCDIVLNCDDSSSVTRGATHIIRLLAKHYHSRSIGVTYGHHVKERAGRSSFESMRLLFGGINSKKEGNPSWLIWRSSSEHEYLVQWDKER